MNSVALYVFNNISLSATPMLACIFLCGLHASIAEGEFEPGPPNGLGMNEFNCLDLNAGWLWVGENVG